MPHSVKVLNGVGSVQRRTKRSGYPGRVGDGRMKLNSGNEGAGKRHCGALSVCVRMCVEAH